MINMWEKLFASSADSKQVSLTIKGVLTLIVPLAGMILNHFGHSLDDSTTEQLTEVLTNVIVAGSTLVSTVMILWGMLRKLYYSVIQS